MAAKQHLRFIILLIVMGLLLVTTMTLAQVKDTPTAEDTSTATSNTEADTSPTQPLAWVLRINGAIGPATSDYITENLTEAANVNVRLVVLAMDTPGGLDSSMREIIRAILDSPVPVASFVSPQGARAASAGTYILYASHIAAMAPGTNLGAATPVQIGGEFDLPKPKSPGEKSDDGANGDDKLAANSGSAMQKKMINDAAAYIRSFAEMRGRNIEWAEQAVREASSLPAHEALQKNVIDLMAEDVADLLQKIDGRHVTLKGQTIELETASIIVKEIVPDWRNDFLSVITNPNVAYILMLIGAYGLFLEFYNPGSIIPGVVGAISLLIALYAFQVLPVNYAGLGLIALGITLMIMEAFVPSTGVLGIGGVVAFVVGSVILMDTDSEAFKIARPLIAAVAVFSAISLVVVINMLMRARRRVLVSGLDAMLEETAVAQEDFSEQGLVRVHGELWQAITEQPVRKGQSVPIKAIKGLKLLIGKIEETKGEGS